MKIVKDRGIVLISIYYLLFGAYSMIYAKVLLTATGSVSCSGTECLMLVFLRMLAWILGVIGFVYLLTAVLIRLHRAGCYLALAASIFNIVLMAAYLLKPTIMTIGLTFILPVRLILTRSMSYSPAQARDLLSIIGSFLEVFIILINFVIGAYLLKGLDRGLWKSDKAEAKQ
jgi:hypothetical protein